MATMKAVTYSTDTGVEYHENYPRPIRGPGQALVKVLLAGICKTDIEITKGYSNFSGVIGHEFLGKVVEVDPNDKNIHVGDRVCGEINLTCGSCNACDAGGDLQRNHCERRRVLGIINKDGTFAEYLTLPVSNLYIVPEEIADLRAVFAEPLAAALRIIEQNLIPKGSKVCLVGDGRLGFLIAEVLALNDINVTVIGKHDKKMAMMSARIRKHKLCSTTSKYFQNEFDVVVEASGCENGLILAEEVVRPLGTIVLKSTFASRISFNTAQFVVKEIKVIGSRCGNFPMALNAMKNVGLEPEKIISKVYHFTDALKALEYAAQKVTMKVILEFD